jgi:capsid protein
LNASQARKIHLEALAAAVRAGTLDVPGAREAAEASRAAPPAT